MIEASVACDRSRNTPLLALELILPVFRGNSLRTDIFQYDISFIFIQFKPLIETATDRGICLFIFLINPLFQGSTLLLPYVIHYICRPDFSRSRTGKESRRCLSSPPGGWQ
ncbi:hypothetical protein [Microvirgula aerodenitrificans]|uniref:hypothetical protein n=1 Tax=Microvirgula aerodenitrificans TaxID=57480 RepID=UPI0028E47C05|nr:hypothetical protein [Microvirgula aerodenitrificans]